MEPLEIYRIYPTKQERQKRVEELMDTVGLARRLANSYPHELMEEEGSESESPVRWR